MNASKIIVQIYTLNIDGTEGKVDLGVHANQLEDILNNDKVNNTKDRTVCMKRGRRGRHVWSERVDVHSLVYTNMKAV